MFFGITYVCILHILYNFMTVKDEIKCPFKELSIDIWKRWGIIFSMD